MNDKPVLDPDRDRAIRAMIVETARAEKSRPSLRARASLLIGLVIAALLVSGGGVAMALTGIIQIPIAAPVIVETPTATPTPMPTPTQTTAPAPPPAPEPTPTAVDVSSWVIGFDGVGPITLGGSMTDASTVLDATDLVRDESGIEGCVSELRRVTADTGASLAVEPDATGSAVGLITVSDFSAENGERLPAALPATEEGITVGSTDTELQAAYPTLGDWVTRGGEPGYWLDDSAGHRIWFTMDSATDVVRSVAVSMVERLGYGGCGD